ncbi:hypothetical protein WCE55_03855 [Luteimonas sp. MJ293]|uniref:hypothetical protein n=1 Tax=Luteimonas sp. MJ146 TaxID=3129240 RepID=UPI0031BB8F8B
MTPRFLQNLLLRYRATGFTAVFAPRKPRHPLVRLLFGLAGVALLAILLVFGVVIGAAMLAVGMALRLLGKPRRAVGRTGSGGTVLDGDYRVVDKPVLR